MKELKVERWTLAELSRARRADNPKLHDIEGIKASIREHGFRKPIEIDEFDRKVSAGHGRIESLLEMQRDGEPPPTNVKAVKGDWSIPVLVGGASTDATKVTKLLIADNRLVELGGWDDAKLFAQLSALKDLGEIDSTGFTENDLVKIEKALAGAAEGTTVTFTARPPEEIECPKCHHHFLPEKSSK